LESPRLNMYPTVSAVTSVHASKASKPLSMAEATNTAATPKSHAANSLVLKNSLVSGVLMCLWEKALMSIPPCGCACHCGAGPYVGCPCVGYGDCC
jgi:hypothetical protein